MVGYTRRSLLAIAALLSIGSVVALMKFLAVAPDLSITGRTKSKHRKIGVLLRV